MSATRNSLPSLPSLPLEPWPASRNYTVQTLHQPVPPPPQTDDTGRVVFTRQLWQRTMPDGTAGEHVVLNKSHSAAGPAAHHNAAGPSRRTSSTNSSRTQRHSPTPSHESKTPLTPEESPPFRSTRKRSAGIVEREDKAVDHPDISPAHTRSSSGESSVHVCICQPDPKIPRPRNAFILYRQHHQASVVAQHPGLANPEISKIIGEQWQNQPPEIKSKWKQLAEEEKIRHQQQYPAYRYQPKRNNRRNSLSQDSTASADRIKCNKCSGRTILAPSTPFAAAHNNSASPVSVPPTPGSAITPVSRTLPVLNELSLQTPATRRAGKFFPTSNTATHNGHLEERDNVGSLSPDLKRRRFNDDHAPTVTRTMPPRYGAGPPGTQVGPGTPFPFGQQPMPPPPHTYSPASAHLRRESLPGLRGVVNAPTPLGPPPRPGMGYQQHRLSQGHIAHDRSLTLPPLQTGNQPAPNTSPGTAGKTVEERIMSINYKYKIKVLCQVAPPASRRPDLPRGPLIAVEGDNADAVRQLSEWLRETLSKDDLAVKLMEGPNLGTSSGKVEAMVQYHQLAAEWLGKSHQILQEMTAKTSQRSSDATMADSTSAPTSAKTPATARRIIDENYDSSDDDAASSKHSADKTDAQPDASAPRGDNQPSPKTSPPPTESMDLDKTPTAASPPPTTTTTTTPQSKPILLIPNYSLHTSNAFALRIPIGPTDPYSPADHWQWTATQWRGIIGPDLTVYVRDVAATESAVSPASVDVGCVEGRGEVGVITVVRKVVGEKGEGEVEPSVLRRLGFEVGEWVRAFGAAK